MGKPYKNFKALIFVLNLQVKEKKKQLKKDGKPPTVEEDDPEVVSHTMFRETGEYKVCFGELRFKASTEVFIRLVNIVNIYRRTNSA